MTICFWDAQPSTFSYSRDFGTRSQNRWKQSSTKQSHASTGDSLPWDHQTVPCHFQEWSERLCEWDVQQILPGHFAGPVGWCLRLPERLLAMVSGYAQHPINGFF